MLTERLPEVGAAQARRSAGSINHELQLTPRQALDLSLQLSREVNVLRLHEKLNLFIVPIHKMDTEGSRKEELFFWFGFFFLSQKDSAHYGKASFQS